MRYQFSFRRSACKCYLHRSFRRRALSVSSTRRLSVRSLDGCCDTANPSAGGDVLPQSETAWSPSRSPVKLFERQRRIILAASMSAVRGRIRREGEVPHLVAHHLTDLSAELASVDSRDSAFPLPHGRGNEFHCGSPGHDPRTLPPKGSESPRYPPTFIGTVKGEPRDFRPAPCSSAKWTRLDLCFT